jgi:LacI family transcriptional regulator
MHEIAERAGVGKATVSLALRDDPRLRPETRRRIQKLAAKMGYRTNATVANLMAQLRAGGAHRYQATLGLLNVSTDPGLLTTLRSFREWTKGCHERAGQLGYALDPFWLHEPGITPARLPGILGSRHIRGLIIATPLDGSGLADGLDPIWRHFSCVVVGIRPARPPLNFSANDQFATAFQAVHRLWGCGCRRVGLVLSPEVDAMVERRYSAGFWAAQETIDRCERIPAFPFQQSREAPFRAWCTQHRPDAILTIHDEVKPWIEQMHINVPGDLALAHLDRHQALPAWSGMDQNNPLIGAAAVDMVVGQLHRNETGLPQFPKASFIQSTWVDGPTTTHSPLRPAARRPAPREPATV